MAIACAGTLLVAWFCSTGGSAAADRKRLASQLVQLDESYPGGLLQYISNARRLLQDSREGQRLSEEAANFILQVYVHLAMIFLASQLCGPFCCRSRAKVRRWSRALSLVRAHEECLVCFSP